VLMFVLKNVRRAVGLLACACACMHTFAQLPGSTMTMSEVPQNALDWKQLPDILSFDSLTEDEVQTSLKNALHNCETVLFTEYRNKKLVVGIGPRIKLNGAFRGYYSMNSISPKSYGWATPAQSGELWADLTISNWIPLTNFVPYVFLPEHQKKAQDVIVKIGLKKIEILNRRTSCTLVDSDCRIYRGEVHASWQLNNTTLANGPEKIAPTVPKVIYIEDRCPNSKGLVEAIQSRFSPLETLHKLWYWDIKRW
jgi:hypothetical protein